MFELKRAQGLLAGAAVALGLFLPAMGAQARTNHAVLVAVTAYPNLPPKAALIGPNHDAALVRDYLLNAAPQRFEPANVAVLADGLEGAKASPTHAAILGELKSVAEKAGRGDFVYLHFSGHGAQQPAAGEGGDETDGLDEIFLPADTSKWADQTKGVPNALADDEIAGALKAIRDKGAFVWVVFDACHSGTATRDVVLGDGGETERKVAFETLGIPESAMAGAGGEEAGTRGIGGEGAGERQAAFAVEPGPVAPGAVEPQSAEPLTSGGMVAFFAAQTVETTPEMPLPKGAADATKYGLFTYTIFSKLAERPNITYRQLGHAVLQQYAADARQRPTPLFEGDLDAKVWGMEGQEVAMQWPLDAKAGTVPAGTLHRLAPGAKLAVLPSPASDISEAIAYVEVKQAKNLSSKVAPVAWEGKSTVKLADLPERAYARLVEIEVDYKLRVAKPQGEAAGEVALVAAALEKLAAAEDKGFRVELVEADEPADLRLAVLPANEVVPAEGEAPALFLLPPSGEIDASGGNVPPRVVIDKADPARLEKGLEDNLRTVFRAVGLSRLAAATDYSPEDFSVSFEVLREGSEPGEPLDGSEVPVVNPGDEVHVRAANNSNKIIDINVLYVGSDWSISHMAAERLVPGASLDEGLLAFTDSSFGTERMIAVLTEAPPQSEIEDLSFLAQPGVPALTRAVGEDEGFGGMLADLGLAASTRAAAKLAPKGGAKGGVMIFSVETRPKG
ncbi:MAG TPA: caspase family protein [Mesorhizobium sp.]|jgi:hypothetical protein|nr:caspase family protein [Mesorhizobium sp.]